MPKHRTHSIEFERQVSQEFLAGETLHGLSQRHDIFRKMIRIWVQKYETGAFDEDAAAVDLLQQYEAPNRSARTACGQAGVGAQVSKGGCEKRALAEKRHHVRYCRPRASASQKDAG